MAQKLNQDEIVKGLMTTAIPATVTGTIYTFTTDDLGVKLADLLRTMYDIPEVDYVTLTPCTDRNYVGLSDMICKVFFDTSTLTDGAKNIYRKGNKNNGNNRNGNQQSVNLMSYIGAASTGTGPFGTSQKFDTVFRKFCPIGDDGKQKLILKGLKGYPTVAELELDFNLVMAMALNIKPDDMFDFHILSAAQLANTKNFVVLIAKTIETARERKGKHGKINYSQIAENEFRRYNSNNRR